MAWLLLRWIDGATTAAHKEWGSLCKARTRREEGLMRVKLVEAQSLHVLKVTRSKVLVLLPRVTEYYTTHQAMPSQVPVDRWEGVDGLQFIGQAYPTHALLDSSPVSMLVNPYG
ncbi:hypothetical protein TNCV_5049941 [Trichonephila clavipes]|nr:hypothetical protein TNCV_5049941 [Trichonephila clavipes]